MNVERFLQLLNADFYTGVPDSQLKALCDCLMDAYGTNPRHHVIAANEGNAMALAAGYHLATGKTGVIYLQNSGEGNIMNPLASLCSNQVYGIPLILVIGWRGEPGVADEPQHVFQGEVTLKLLNAMNVIYCIIDSETKEEYVERVMSDYRKLLAQGRQVAFVVRKGALSYEKKTPYRNSFTMRREEVIRHILSTCENDPIICTTGKASRELYELREEHSRDFLTVGSMGHTSSIALGIALQRPEKKIWIIDGDGSALMHMGAMAVLGAAAPKNIVHIIINNTAHESVGGQPTVADRIDFVTIARGCGYMDASSVSTFAALNKALLMAKTYNKLTLIEAKCAIGSREDLGRPKTPPAANKEAFMQFLKDE